MNRVPVQVTNAQYLVRGLGAGNGTTDMIIAASPASLAESRHARCGGSQ